MTASTATADAAGTVLAQLRSALPRLRVIPPAHRTGGLTLGSAAAALDCTVEVVEELLAEGLPCVPGPHGPRLDHHDVNNLALIAGRTRSTAFQAERRLMRLALGGPQDWTRPRQWRLRLDATCTSAGHGCVDAIVPDAPAPELLGGRLDRLVREGDALLADVTTNGHVDVPRSPETRQVFDDVLDSLLAGDLDFSWLPWTMRDNPVHTADRHLVVDCVVAAGVMAQLASHAGLPVRTRTGFLLGIVGVEHAWAEVFEDNRWLPLDPVLAFLARRHLPDSSAYTAFCRGSVHNRLLAWPGVADQPLATHSCVNGSRPIVTCRQLSLPSTDPHRR